MRLWQLVTLMALVTYLPRLLPMLLLKDLRLPPLLDSFLSFVPYAALGALIFPGILGSTGDLESSIAGGMVALVLAFLRLNVMIVVFGSILTVYFWNLML